MIGAKFANLPRNGFGEDRGGFGWGEVKARLGGGKYSGDVGGWSSRKSFAARKRS